MIVFILLQAVVCGFLCAMCHLSIDSFEEILQTDTPPKELAKYMAEPVNLPAAEACKLDMYSTRFEICDKYGEIQTYIDKRVLVQEAIEEQRSMPIGYILSAVGICFCVFFAHLNTAMIALLLVCNAVSHIFFFKWAAAKHEQRMGRPTSWNCYSKEIYVPENVYICVCQALKSVRYHYETIKGIYDSIKLAKQVYLVLAALTAFVVAFTI